MISTITLINDERLHPIAWRICGMSKRSRRREEGVMPATGAGLMRFFQDEMKGVKFSPVVVTILSVGLIALVILAWLRSYSILPI
jgi:preprotein translocase subunit Sec61beta